MLLRRPLRRRRLVGDLLREGDVGGILGHRLVGLQELAQVRPQLALLRQLVTRVVASYDRPHFIRGAMPFGSAKVDTAQQVEAGGACAVAERAPAAIPHKGSDVADVHVGGRGAHGSAQLVRALCEAQVDPRDVRLEEVLHVQTGGGGLRWIADRNPRHASPLTDAHGRAHGELMAECQLQGALDAGKGVDPPVCGRMHLCLGRVVVL